MSTEPVKPLVFEMDKRDDPVDRMLRDCTAGEFVEWMVRYHGLSTDSAKTIEINLREQFKWHRLQGRLDRPSALTVLAQIVGARGSVSQLNTPE